MAARSARWIPLFLIAVLLFPSRPEAQKGPVVADVLQAAGDYLVQYAGKLAAVAGEEEYLQYDTSSGQMSTPRRLSADLVLVGGGAGTITSFRDVFAMDNQPVRPRGDRVLALLQTRNAGGIEQARQLSEASVRHYIGENLHALDQPEIALQFLRKENQGRSAFKLDGVKNMGGASVAILKFSEKDTPRLIPSPENAPANGRFWIDAATGTVRQTEISISGRSSSVLATVKYAADPVEMTQQTHATAQGTGMNNMGSGGGYGGRQSLESRATYSKYRQVAVDLTK
jgi:hypothetical protein